MRHFEAKSTMRLMLLAALTSGAIACSSDSDHGPPVGAPNAPVVIGEGGGSGGGVGDGQGASNNAGNVGNPATAGTLNGFGGSGGSSIDPAGAGSSNLGSAGTTSQPPFGVSGSSSAFGGSGF